MSCQSLLACHSFTFGDNRDDLSKQNLQYAAVFRNNERIVDLALQVTHYYGNTVITPAMSKEL